MNGFDALAPDYDRLRPGGDDWAEVADRALRALGPSRRLLDAGCGTGRFAVYAVERLGGRVWGVDVSAAMLEQARTRPGAGRVGWRRASVERLPFRAAWFDAVHAHLVMHLVDRPAAIAEVARVLQPGGRIVVGTFAVEHFAEYFLTRWFPSIRAIDEARFPDPDVLAGELAAAGFDRCVVERIRQERTTPAADVLERVRGQYISTLRLLDDGEYAAGLEALEREVEGGTTAFRQTLEWALVSGRRG